VLVSALVSKPKVKYQRGRTKNFHENRSLIQRKIGEIRTSFLSGGEASSIYCRKTRIKLLKGEGNVAKLVGKSGTRRDRGEGGRGSLEEEKTEQMLIRLERKANTAACWGGS